MIANWEHLRLCITEVKLKMNENNRHDLLTREHKSSGSNQHRVEHDQTEESFCSRKLGLNKKCRCAWNLSAEGVQAGTLLKPPDPRASWIDELYISWETLSPKLTKEGGWHLEKTSTANFCFLMAYMCTNTYPHMCTDTPTSNYM